MKSIPAMLLALLIAIPLKAQDEPVAEEKDTTPEVLETIEIEEAEKVIEAEDPEETAVSDTVRVLGKVELVDAPDKTRVSLGEDEILIIEDNGDSVRIKLGGRNISIIEGKNGTEIKVFKRGEEDKNDHESCKNGRWEKRRKRFKPHWAGIDVGINNYLTPGGRFALPSHQDFMTLNSGRSWNWNLNFLEYGFGLGTSYAGLVSGLGLEFTNYSFENQNGIMKDPLSKNIVPLYLSSDANIIKSKLKMTYLTVPLMLEFQIPAGKKRIHISGGVIAGVKLLSSTKLKYSINGDKNKDKIRGDYNLNPIRWGFTARVGYRMLSLYANYYMTPLFKTNTGPELYPFSVGLALIPF